MLAAVLWLAYRPIKAPHLARLLGLERVPAVLVVDEGQSPALMAGPGEPLLVLPWALLTRLDGDELDTVLLHELAHLRRKDGLVRWLEIAAGTLFWWTRRRLRDAEEACCDEVVLRHFPQHASAYAGVLVKTLALQHDRALPATVSTMTSVHRMEERLEMILHGHSCHRRRWLTIVVGVLSLAVVSVRHVSSARSD